MPFHGQHTFVGMQAPVEFGAVLILALTAWWLPVYGARHCYKGPRHSFEERQEQLHS